MRKITALLAGIFFGTGLILSDMVNPARVRAFLDILGEWDPTLAFVMIGAISVTAIAWRIAANRQKSFLGADLPAPANPKVDGRLLAGSALFGLGWGIAGTCTAPAITTLIFGKWELLVFFGAMIAGMFLFHFQERIRAKRGEAVSPR